MYIDFSLIILLSTDPNCVESFTFLIPRLPYLSFPTANPLFITNLVSYYDAAMLAITS